MVLDESSHTICDLAGEAHLQQPSVTHLGSNHLVREKPGHATLIENCCRGLSNIVKEG